VSHTYPCLRSSVHPYALSIATQTQARKSGWCSKICGAFPQIGKQFEKNVCEDSQLLLNNYDPTATT